MATKTTRRSSKKNVSYDSRVRVSSGRTSGRLSRKDREEELKALVQVCFLLLHDYTQAQVAYETGLCPATISRLSRGNVSLATNWGTIEALGYAAGLQISWTDTFPVVSLID